MAGSEGALQNRIISTIVLNSSPRADCAG